MKTRILGLAAGLLISAQSALADDNFDARYDGAYQTATLDLSAIYMTRSAPDSRTILTTVGAPINANQFDFDWETGSM